MRIAGDIAFDTYIYTYGYIGGHAVMITSKWDADNGMFLQFGEDGAIVIYKLVNGSQEWVRTI